LPDNVLQLLVLTYFRLIIRFMFGIDGNTFGADTFFNPDFINSDIQFLSIRLNETTQIVF
jgi:hypothetical protein